MRTPPVLRELALGDPPATWGALGFEVVGAACRIGSVALRLSGAGGGLLGWTLAGDGSGPLDGVPTAWAPAGVAAEPAGPHPNGITRIDHVVLVTDALARTLGALTSAGAEVRRVAPERGQAFLWLGDVICEVVERGDGPPRLWGLTLVSPDLDATVAGLGPLAGEVRDAVQPGRRIATLRREAGLGVPVALMSPHVKGSNPVRG